jgi:hypothetical protein
MSETLVRVPPIATDVAESMLRALKESLRALEKHRQHIIHDSYPGGVKSPGTIG